MYRKPLLIAPWGGWMDGLPSIAVKANSFRQIVNFLVSKGRIFSAPAFGTGPKTNTGNVLRMRSFQDSAAGFHTVALTSQNIEHLVAGAWVTLNQFSVGTIPYTPIVPAATFPWTTEVYQNILFFSAGPQTLSFWTGGVDINRKLDSELGAAGDVPGGCLYLGKLDSRLIMLNTFENQWQYPRRVRWCGVNNAMEWNSQVDPSSGALDISEVEDSITGWSVGNNVGYIYRNFGISSMTPTGNPNIPFLIENFSAGPKGVGVYTAATLATWGSMAMFRAENDFYILDAGQLNAVGGQARKSILLDIEASSGQVSASIIGSVVPGVDFLSYWLICPQSATGDAVIWVYSKDDNTWCKVQAPTLTATNYMSTVDSVYLD